MSTIAKIKEELEDVEVLRGISSALLEISSIKIRSLRDDFETNKTFYEEVSELYRMVKLSAKRRNYSVQKGSQEKKIHVAVTSNKRFHGTLNYVVMDVFVNDMKEKHTEYLIVGHTGKHFMEDTKQEKKCEYLSFKDDYPTPSEMEVFLERVRKYGKVVLYYPEFVNIFTQTAAVTDITYSSEVNEEKTVGREIEQIYEPELPHILTFFEVQVRKLLFTRIMLESELSRTAARLIKMNSTEDRAEEAIGEKKALLRRQTTLIEDVRLLETFSSTVQWKKK